MIQIPLPIPLPPGFIPRPLNWFLPIALNGANIRRITCDMLLSVEEGRKRVLLIAATILAARKLAQFDKPCPGIEAAISNSVAMAEKIMRRIDALYPAKQYDAKAPYEY